jgi:elongation factor Ts
MEKIKQLREKTGAGMVDCKKALEETGGDIDKAVELLRKKGIAKAAKRGEREANEGVIKVAVSNDKKEAYILELNAETDFVARNEKFQKLADDIMAKVKAEKPADMESLFGIQMEVGTVKENLDNLSGTIGEKIVLNKFEILKTDGQVLSYSHLGGRIGVLVAFDKEIDDELGTDIAMQIAALSPKYVKPEEVPEDEIAKEKEIYKEQLLKEGKPENIIDKILNGKVNKYYEEVCLIKQEFIKEDKKKVEEVLGEAKVEKFVRYSL